MIPENILDSIASRFLVGLGDQERNAVERLFFAVEEAHWFLIDNYKISDISFADFSRELLDHIGIRVNIEEALRSFVKYRQSVKVYGAILVDSNISYVLAVKEKKKTKNYSFPKGKKCMDEDGTSCAIREVYEETGYDVQNKICNLPITIFDKITLYFVFNVKQNFPFEAQTRKEIEEIKWLSTKKLSKGEYRRGYSIVSAAFKKASYLLEAMRKSKFKFNTKKIVQRIDRLLGQNRAKDSAL
ncbi:mRNA decapping enzyme 2 [Encephalitozoon hellem ATCC 50504]|uniref:mRNA decapping enzyme 2 n=1 Tax=Encephalitozoon hellem TaxID=27973 RepID=A0A9Q9C6U4_ENCHE|nr:mRNA decapping enzyme 2 [Encephalitozoon hellem ATCC 50504]AFM98683.1 mRNA decapping enzyme 2 [Encephalitozoon hellem ATCC 50504]UTX43632.1 mRNA decapping enzyme 2 [Encephalitozoon hellem]WEL39107.1 mRNA decapping enzyme 2 [Encephalitozoon hellem]|eukprot:XP_003887664.1 mRNA decapping enzyme 2 [Encephalitozoon hellem ATCC 50504]